MIKNYLLVAIRNLIKNKLFVVVNILGIGIAIASCIVAYYNVRFHFDFNDQHRKKEQIYKISITREINNRSQAYGVSPATLGPSIGNSIPGLEEVVRYTNPTLVVRCGEHVFNKRIGFAEENFFKVFDFDFIRGNSNALKNKNTVLINQSMAESSFGDEDPIGKLLTVFADDGKAYSFMVGAVYTDLPENSSFRCQLLCLIDNYFTMNHIDEFNWNGWVAATFLLIPDQTKASVIEAEINNFVAAQNDLRPDWMVASFYLEKLKDIPTTGRNLRNNSLKSGLHPAALIAPPIMAVLLLILACLNFMNTSLATSSNRLKEIGVRKTMGGIRWHTIIQFLSENVLVCFLGLLTGLLISTYLIDAFSDMWPYMTLKMNFSESLDLWLFLLGLLLFTGILAGAYPAFYISRFNPVRILKGDVKYGGAGFISKVLLVIQFSFAIMGIVCAALFMQNARYQQTLDLGFNKDHVIVMPIDENAKLVGLKNEIIQNPMIKSIGESKHHIARYNASATLEWAEKKQEVMVYTIGDHYFDAMELKLISGSTFDMNTKESDRGKAIIVNEKLVNDFGWKDDPIGKRLKLNENQTLTVVGVVKDFYDSGFWRKIVPNVLLFGKKDEMHHLIINVDQKNLTQVNEYLKSVWKENFPDTPYAGFYQHELTDGAINENRQIIKIFNFLAIVSTLLSMIGLYTLVSLTIIKKTKEIGIRKVLGASYKSLVKIINRDYTVIILLACIFGGYLGYFASGALMGSIWKYYIHISVFHILAPILLIIIVSVITVFRKVYLAANQNPVEALKYE